MLKESCNLSEQETKLATPNQEWKSHNSTLIQMPFGHTSFLNFGKRWFSDTQNTPWQKQGLKIFNIS